MKLECFVEAYADWFAGQLTTAKLSATAITTPEHIATLISRTLSTRNNMPVSYNIHSLLFDVC